MTNTNATTPIGNMTQYKDPQGSFLISYPTSWTATPATNRFETIVVTISSTVIA
jgi:hypothetical protein